MHWLQALTGAAARIGKVDRLANAPLPTLLLPYNRYYRVQQRLLLDCSLLGTEGCVWSVAHQLCALRSVRELLFPNVGPSTANEHDSDGNRRRK
jgi:hypothetical protein